MAIKVRSDKISEDLFNQIVQDVQYKIEFEHAFTSVDITKNLRINNPNTTIYNKDIAEVLRTVVLSISHDINVPYCATLIEVSTQNGKVFTYLYHSVYDDTNNYTNTNQNISKTTTQQVNSTFQTQYPNWKAIKCWECNGHKCIYCDYTGTLYVSVNDRVAVAPGKSFRGQKPGLYQSI